MRWLRDAITMYVLGGSRPRKTGKLVIDTLRFVFEGGRVRVRVGSWRDGSLSWTSV